MKVEAQVTNLKANSSKFIGISNEQSCWETPYKRVLWKLIYITNCSEQIKSATWLSNTYITNTRETFSQLLIKAPYVFLRFFCDPGLM